MKRNPSQAGKRNSRASQSKQSPKVAARSGRKTTGQTLKPARASAPRVRLKVPMPPALLRAVESAAQQLGISRDELFARAIEAQLKEGPEAAVPREVVQQLEDARNMRFAVDYLLEHSLAKPEVLALPDVIVCGVQEIDGHLHSKLGAVLGALSPAHAEPAGMGMSLHGSVCCAHYTVNTLLHLLITFVIKENSLGYDAQKNSLACGLVNLTSWASAEMERSTKAVSDEHHAMFLLLQRLAEADGTVSRADFAACGVAPKAASAAKGGAQ